MAQTIMAVRLTPLAALLDASLRTSPNGHGLATTLAILRMPSRTWMTYDAIAALLETHASGRTLNRVSIKTYTEGVFGIPNTRYINLGTKVIGMPKAVDEATVQRYLDALDARFIDVDAVRAVAAEEALQARLAAESAAEETAAVAAEATTA